MRLTETVAKGGCAAKLPAGQLRRLLASMKQKQPAELRVGTETMDDACLWDLGQGEYLVQTLDFFTPIVDDARDFGAIAAANALSDVYAMGGMPKLALTILAFPTAALGPEVLDELMGGALETLSEAGVALAGGHSIDDETLKLGFSVTGFVCKDKTWTNAGAKPGAVLLLTKALGTGVLSTALKNKKAKEEWVRAATQSMRQLNRAPELLEGLDVQAATDITGFGLAGHSLQLARASGVRIEIDCRALPVLEGALEALGSGLRNRAHTTNAAYATEVEYHEVSEELRLLTVDAQTSGGLLLAIREEDAEAALARLLPYFPQTRIIGRICDGAGLEFH